MKSAKLERVTYERWASDLRRLQSPPPTEAEAGNAHLVNTVDAMTTMHGCIIRTIAMSGGSIDLHLNAAQAIHLFRNLAVCGVAGGWMDEEGRPTTEPPVTDDLQVYPVPKNVR